MKVLVYFSFLFFKKTILSFSFCFFFFFFFLDRLELYYDDEEQARLLTVKFEPGTHLLVRHVDDIPWSLEEWEKHFRISEDDSEECL